MGHDDPGFLAVGYLARAHGIDGEMLVTLLTDHPEGTFAPGVVLRLADPSGARPDPDLPPLRVVASRPFKADRLVTFGGVESRNEAEALRGRYLLRPADEVPPLAEDEVFFHQLLGLEVVTVDGEVVGHVRELYEVEPTVLLEIRGEGREVLIPFRPGIVAQVDVAGGRLVIDPPEGLLDL